MLQLFYKLYFFFLRGISYEHFFQKVFTLLANVVFPIYFYCTRGFKGNQLEQREFTKNNEEYYVVSLTSFPGRIDKLWLCIETILRQEVKPDELILWLYEGEFMGIESLPKKLLAQQKRGLQIRFCKENLMPHKKYFYSMQEFPDANIITIDDDFFFPTNLIKKLKEFHVKYPKEILCPITMEIKIINNKLQDFMEWQDVKINTKPSYLYLTMGGGGTLFPKNSIHLNAFNKSELISMAIKTDDLWLKIMSIRMKTKVLSMAGEYPRFYIAISHSKDSRLMNENIFNGQNDKVFKSLLQYYNISESDFID